jgi:hypothetical protein
LGYCDSTFFHGLLEENSAMAVHFRKHLAIGPIILGDPAVSDCHIRSSMGIITKSAQKNSALLTIEKSWRSAPIPRKKSLSLPADGT